MARIAFVPAILLCTFLLIFSSTFPCGRYIEDRPLTSSFLYFLVFVVVGFISVWINKKHACLLFALHVFTGLSAICLVYTTSTSCPYVFTNPSLSDLSITVISDYFRNYTDRTEVLFDPRYTGGSFRFTDGEVVTDLMRTIEHPRTTPWRVAPLVPSLAKWNRTDPVMAWAVCPLVHFFPDSSKEWKNRNLREGFLLFSDQWKLGAIKEIAREMRIKTPEIVPVFQWRDVDEAFNFAVVYLVMSNVVVYFGLVIICMGTWYYKYRVLDPQTDQGSSIRGSYLLQDLSHTPWYGSNK